MDGGEGGGGGGGDEGGNGGGQGLSSGCGVNGGCGGGRGSGAMHVCKSSLRKKAIRFGVDVKSRAGFGIASRIAKHRTASIS